MAKRRKEKDEEEDKPFKLPKFDEAAFLKRERRNIRATFISFLFGCFMALICFGFWALMGRENALRWELVLLVAVIDAAFLKYIFLKLNLDLTDFGRKNWFGSYASYFFTWLIVFIVLVNPPFYDDEDPRMEVIVLPGMQEPGGDIIIWAKITDNAGVEKSKIKFSITYPDGTSESPKFEYEDNIFMYNFSNPNNLMGDFSYTLSVTDNSGLKIEERGSFTYSNDTIKITSSQFDGLTSGDSITIKADKKISKKNFRVYYKVDNGSEINTNRVDSKDKEKYYTTPEFEGWKENSNVTIKIYAEVIYYFENVFDSKGNLIKFSNIVEDTTVYNFTTGKDSDIGSEDPPVEYNCTLALKGESQPNNVINYSLPCPRFVSAPGFEILVFLISLVVVVLIFKYRKKDRRNQK